MRPLLIFFLCLSATAQLQKQPAADKQSSQKQVSKSETDQPVTDTRQQNTETVGTQTRAVESEIAAGTSGTSKQNYWPQTVKEINDTLLVIFTGVLAFVGYLQWKALREHERWMKRNVAIARSAARAATKNAATTEHALKLSERAEVLLDGAVFDHGQVLSGKNCRVVAVFKNFGRTSAKNTKVTLNLVIDDVPPTDCGAIPPVTLGAGGTVRIGSERFVEFMTEKTANDIFSGRTSLRFESEATYLDVFDCGHRTFVAGLLDMKTSTFRIESQEAD